MSSLRFVALAIFFGLSACAPPAQPTQEPPRPRHTETLVCEGAKRDCDEIQTNGCETNVTSSTEHCGACGKRCDPGDRCDVGRCVMQAPSVVFGDAHLCVLWLDGLVGCRGNDPLGLASGAEQLKEVGPARALAAGDGFACAIVDQRVYCWGDERSLDPALAGAGEPKRIAPKQMTELGEASLLSAARGRVCATNEQGEVHCIGSVGAMALPAPSNVLDAAVSLSLSGTKLCQLSRNGTISCEHNERIDGVWGASRLSTSDGHGCALLSSGRVVCWHDDLSATRQSGVVTSASTTINGFDDAIDLSVSRDGGCVVEQGGRVSCWGRSLSGLLGATSSETDAIEASELQGASRIFTSSSGPVLSCATSPAWVKCWGDDVAGVLGLQRVASAPTELEGIDDATDIALGETGGCALRAGGALVCWGQSQRNVRWRGVGDEVPRASIASTQFDAVLRVGSEVCAKRRGGQVACPRAPFDADEDWMRASEPLLNDALHASGDSAHGGVAILATAKGSTQGKLWPALLRLSAEERLAAGASTVPSLEDPPGVSQAKRVAGSWASGCAITADGAVACWDRSGGPSDPIATSKPKDLKGAVDLAVAGDAVCAIVARGAVRCGKVAGGATESVTGLSMAEALQPFDGGFCALQKSGQVMCWARDARAAQPVAGLSDARKLATFDDSACAVTAKGKVRCWGSNHFARIGLRDVGDYAAGASQLTRPAQIAR